MVTSKKQVSLDKILFLYLALLPLGQLLKFKVNFLAYTVPINISDLIVFISLFWLVIIYKKIPEKYKIILNILYVTLFSYIFSLSLFELKEVVIGGLHLVRLISYFSFSIYVFFLIKLKVISKSLITKSLVLVYFLAATAGWLQYLFFPDLRQLIVYGWDDHLYRLTGTFLDPGFSSLLFVFGFIIAYIYFIKNRRIIYLALSAFFLVTVGFTYSRAGYLTLLSSILMITIMIKTKKSIVLALMTVSFFILVIAYLPRPGGVGVELKRTHSILNRVENYYQTLVIYKKSPVFGVGFNNICSAKQNFLGDTNSQSHSCGGSDSSILLILASTGIVGLLVFSYSTFVLVKSVKLDINGLVFLVSLVSLLIHSLFVNSVFYPFVMGSIGILYALTSKGNTKTLFT